MLSTRRADDSSLLEHGMAMEPLHNRSGDENVERYHSIIETAVDAVITVDETGHIESANPATERMFGHREAEPVGQIIGTAARSPACAWTARASRRTGGQMRVAGRGILRDISDRVSAEERHRAIVETASTGSSPSPPTARCTR